MYIQIENKMNNYVNSGTESELNRMRELMGYGLNENKKTSSSNSTVEYHQLGADGNTYGIIKECNKFYIKVAPKKDTEILAEDYDYIGGYMNKKEYEYPSYTIASKQFGLKMKSLNEAFVKKGKKNVALSETKHENAEWQVKETKEMRAEIDRFKQISNNVEYILSEDKTAKALELGSKDVDEDGGNAYQEETKNPTETINNMKPSAKQPKDADNTFSEKPMETKAINNMKENSTDPKKADNTYSEKAKPIKEAKTFKLTEEQAKKVLAWQDDKNYMDTSNGTEIGDSAPYDNNVNITNEAVYNSEDMSQHVDDPKKYMEPFDDKVKNELSEEVGIDQNGLPGEMITDDFAGDNFETDEFGDEFGDNFDYEFGDDEMLPDQVLDYETRDDMEDVLESITRKVVKNILKENGFANGGGIIKPSRRNTGIDYIDKQYTMGPNGMGAGGGVVTNDIPDYSGFMDDGLDEQPYYNEEEGMVNETKLDVFGKHPAYRKSPFTLPDNREINDFGEDWNDDSTKGDEPFGSKILHGGDPYTEKIVDMLTDSIMEKLMESFGSKKKV